MRTRSGAFAAALCGVAAIATPAVATAAPRHDHGLTITTTANPITDGSGVDIYGQLTGPNVNGQQIELFHKIAPADRFTYVQTVRTNSTGYYQFNRADGVVSSNREWFVKGPDGTHSRTIDELVHADVTLSESTDSTTTGPAVDFTGTVSPDHRYERVYIQEQTATNGNSWHTIAEGRTNGASAFSIEHRFRVPNDYTLRAYFPRDARNLGGVSDEQTLAVQQAQNPNFTISSNSSIIKDGSSVTITGTLASASSTARSVTLFGRTVGGRWEAIASDTTSGGSYTFTQTPTRNMVYYVRTSSAPYSHSRALFIGVQDVVTLATPPATAQEGDVVTFSGNVTPDKDGHLIYLQLQDPSGAWQNVAVTTVGGDSAYTFNYRFGEFGPLNLRVRIYGGPVNIGAASAPVTVNVNAVAAPATLPAAPAN